MELDETNKAFLELFWSIEKDLLNLYGPLMSGEHLYKALGYRSVGAFRQSIKRETVPVELFNIKNRRGRFALTKEVAFFLAETRLGNFDLSNGGG